MTQIQVDPTLRQMLHGLTEQVELCDAKGRVLGHFFA